MFKKSCAALAASLLISSNAMAGTLTTYEDVVSKLAAGKTVMLSIDATKCTTKSGDASNLRRLVVKFNDLYEFETSYLNGKKMRATAVQETGLFGDKRFLWYRTLTLILEDNSVAFISDNVDPTSFNLTKRVDLLCKLTADNSGGVIATVLQN